MPQLHQLITEFSELDPVKREELALGFFEKMPFLNQLVLKCFQPQSPDEHPSIVSTPNVCGGAARLIRTRIPVWTLERMRQLGASEIDILRSYPTLGAIDLVQAWSYAARNRNEIEKAIRENEEE